MVQVAVRLVYKRKGSGLVYFTRVYPGEMFLPPVGYEHTVQVAGRRFTAEVVEGVSEFVERKQAERCPIAVLKTVQEDDPRYPTLEEVDADPNWHRFPVPAEQTSHPDALIGLRMETV